MNELSMNSQGLNSEADKDDEMKNGIDDFLSEKKFSCTSCKNAYFETKEEHKAHYKTEWHIDNTVKKVNVKYSI
jgi:hypothetical protein